MRAHSPEFHPSVVDADAEADLYAIRIRGVLSERLLRAFPDLEATTRGGETVLMGALPDQAALYGVLAQIEALGLKLLEVRHGSFHTDSPERS
jgi:hypothetical protein